MEQSRTDKNIKNAKWSLILQITSILTSFITRTVFVRTLGIEYNGLNGLFNEVIAMMSLAELGIGSAIVYSLYRPLAEHDIPVLKRLMGLFKTAYRIIAGVILLMGIVLFPFIHLIVKDTGFDLSYIRVIFVLFVMQAALSYLFAYKRSLLNADQNNYIVSLVTLIFNLFLAAAGIGILLATHNYIMYLSLQIVVSLGSNIAISCFVDRKYPFVKKTQKALPAEKRHVLTNVKHIFIGTLSGKITSSTDNILISVLVNTYQIGIYSNYSLIMNAVMNIFRKIAESVTGGIGNLMVTESMETVDRMLRRFSFLFFVMGFCAALILYSVLTPFIQLWIGESYTISNTVLFISVFNVFLFVAREPLWKTVMVAGVFRQDKNISIIGSSINLAVSILLGKFWGMAGIFLGTTCTLLIQIVLKIILLYREKFEHVDIKEYIALWMQMCLLTAGGMLVVQMLCQRIAAANAIFDLLLKGLAAGTMSLLAVIVLFRKRPEYIYCRDMVKHILLKR